MKTPREIIQDHAFFFGLEPAHLDMIAECASGLDLDTDHVLFREGEPANAFYLIEQGRVAVEAHVPGDGNVLVQVLGPGDVLGWSWLFPPFSWHFQARTLEPVRAVKLDGGHLLGLAEKNKEFGYRLMKRVARVVIQRLQSTRKKMLASDVAAHP